MFVSSFQLTMFLLLFFIKLVCAFVVSFGITFYLVPLLSDVAYKLGILDNPDGKLKNHKKPTPYLGGVAIFVGFITSLALVLPFENNLVLFLLGSTLLLFVGLMDDLIIMKPYQKFFGQIIATLCFLRGGFYLKETFLIASFATFGPLFWLIISFFWILSVINAFNLVDIMDGLATTLAMWSTTAFLCIAIFFGLPSPALLLASFLGSLCAFFWFNKPVAKMYLGDAGSLFIGGLLATVPFMLPWGTYTPYGYFAPVVILLIPLCEVGTLILVRSYKKIPFYQGSPDHFAIYLKRKGWSVSNILTYVSLLSLILSLISVLFVFNMISLQFLFIFILIFLVFWYTILFIKLL